MTVKLEVYRDGWTGGIQVSIGDEDGGYRLLGPKFNGSGVLLASTELDKGDADNIREYLDAIALSTTEGKG